jgi:hypothetical protein
MSRYSLTGDPTDVERSLMLCDEVLIRCRKIPLIALNILENSVSG